MTHVRPFGMLLLWAVALTLTSGSAAGAQPRAYDVADLSARDRLVILVFGDGGTGEAGQYRVGHAMAEICRQRGCDLGLMLGDVIYENGIEIRNRSDADASFAEIIRQFDQKFERPYQRFTELSDFHFWVSLGNHDYRRNAVGALMTYSEFSALWRFPAFHYDVPRLPRWVQVYAVHTDTDVRRDLNGLQIASAKRALCDVANPDRWKLVFGHHTIYNSGHHRGDGNERRVRALLEEPLLRECGVHVYFAGHAHHQEHLSVPGFEQVIQGAAAKSQGRNRAPRGASIRQRFFSRTFGFAVVEVDPGRMRMDFYDVLNTREKADTITLPTADEIVRSYSWCGTRDDIGRPDLDASPCP